MRQWLAFGAVAGLSTMMWIDAAHSRSLLHDVERGLNNVKRELCAAVPSSKCKPVRKTKPATKAPDAVPVEQVPAKVPKPEAKPGNLKVPQANPPLPKVKPKDLKVAPPPAAPVPPNLPQKVEPPPTVPAAEPPKPPEKVEPPPPPPVVTPPPPTPSSPEASNCLKALAAAGVTFSPVPQPGTAAECTVDNPVRLTSLKTALGLVKLPDQPTVNCAFALQLESFVSNDVQPLAQSEMQSPVVAMGTGPGFDCRGRNGDSAAKVSEHAKGNAVDIVFFNFGNKVGVLVKDALDTQAQGFGFLRDVRAAACKDFTTVLGPGANSAHAEHFHIDLEERKGGYRICE